MTELSDFLSVLNTVRDHPGREMYRDWTDLQWTLAVLDSHFDELLRTTARLNQAFTAENQPQEKVIGDREVDVIRSFQGYFSCAYTLYEQAQHVKNSHICLNEGSKKRCNCEACSIIVSALEEKGVLPRWIFIQRLRAYFQHRRSPNIIQMRGPDSSQSTTHLVEIDDNGRIILLPDGFVQFEKGSRATDYVRDRGEFDLVKEVQEFHQSIFEYYDWYYGYLLSSNQEVVNDWVGLVEHLRTMLNGRPESLSRQVSNGGKNSGEETTSNEFINLFQSLRVGGHQFRSVIDNFPNTTEADTLPTFTNREADQAISILQKESIRGNEPQDGD